MKYGSLFTGIGGFDLGFDRAGMECAWQVEIDRAVAARVAELGIGKTAASAAPIEPTKPLSLTEQCRIARQSAVAAQKQ